MFALRMKRLADTIVDYSIDLQAGEVVYIEVFDIPHEMLEALVDKVYETGAVPLISQKSMRVIRRIYQGATEKSMDVMGDVELYKIKKVDAYIGMKGPSNITEHIDVPQEKWDFFNQYWWEPAHLCWRVPKTRWVTLRWPTPAMAQQARMSTEAFEDFYFTVCALDYSVMSQAMDALKKLMEQTDEVWIKGPETDLKFSIKGLPVVKGDGHRNLPDGEVFTAPVRESLEGMIAFNVPTIHRGRIFHDVKLKFQRGRIVEATASDRKGLNDILDTDEGARYVGEFALGLNPYIEQPMTDIIFDEKMAGSIHLALGMAYRTADNGNESKLHWDMILNQTDERGGGQIYFDGQLIRNDGVFVPDELSKLNPENLKTLL